MAVTPNTDAVFLREVDEELRRDQLIGFWRRWGIWLVGGFVVFFVALAGWLYWQHVRDVQARKEGEELQQSFDALADNKTGRAAELLAPLSTSDSAGYRGAALLAQADILLQKNDLKGAAVKFGQAANDSGLPRAIRDLALLRKVNAEFDTVTPDRVVAQLKPLAVKGEPYFGSAGELMAIAYLKANRPAEARRLFAAIANDNGVPASIRQRAAQMAGQLKEGAGAPAPTPTPTNDASKDKLAK